MTQPDFTQLRIQLAALHDTAASLLKQAAVLLAALPAPQQAAPREPEIHFADGSHKRRQAPTPEES